MKKLISGYYLKELSNIFVVSNTPMFLFSRYKNHPSVENLHTISFDIIKCKIKLINNKQNITQEDNILLYAILVSLVYRNVKEAKILLELFNIDLLKWGSILKKYVEYELVYTPSDIISKMKIDQMTAESHIVSDYNTTYKDYR